MVAENDRWVNESSFLLMNRFIHRKGKLLSLATGSFKSTIKILPSNLGHHEKNSSFLFCLLLNSKVFGHDPASEMATAVENFLPPLKMQEKAFSLSIIKNGKIAFLPDLLSHRMDEWGLPLEMDSFKEPWPNSSFHRIESSRTN